MLLRLVLATACALAGSVPASAADTALGTFTVKGKTHVLKQVYVTRAVAADSPTTAYLSVLVSDVPIAADARSTARLVELAKTGGIHAVRVVWSEGFDRIVTTPFAAGVDDNGQPTTGGAVIDLQAYDEQHLKAKITSKMLGQDWHFNATLSAAVVRVALTDENRRDTTPVLPPTGVERDTRVEADGRVDATADKRTLGRLGYVYDDESFMRAVTDGSLEAVRLFLRLGTSPNVKDGDTFALISAAMMCTREPQGDRLAIVQAMLAAKATVDVKDMNGSTPLLWSVNAQCPADFVRTLVTAGANVNVKAKGGGTPLMLAKVFNRADVVEILVKAGAK